MKKVIVLGASGIIGQHMRLQIPENVIPIWVRHNADRMHLGMELNDSDGSIFRTILAERPDAVVNLAGQADTDEVGKNPDKYHYINVMLPGLLAEFCQRQNIHYVHVSSQAVFDGMNPPYHEDSPVRAINAYGQQKIEAEQRVKRVGSCWTIVRPSFVMGIRPMRHVGRMNPAEQMMTQTKQVADRWFTANLAEDVASTLWNLATGSPQVRVIHVAGMAGVSRHELATAMGLTPEAVSHESFSGLSPRPEDTTYKHISHINIVSAMRELAYLYNEGLGPRTRAREISLFTGMHESKCRDVLRRGFMELHGEVAEDFHRYNPKNDDELLGWYRDTMAYIWELTAYHLDAGFNYSGMCNGVANHIKDHKRVLVLGDGIGDMTLTLRRAGIDAVYHDLRGSRTAQFAQMRLWLHTGEECEALLSNDWKPPRVMPESYDAICTADFMEHLPNVEEWVRWIAAALKPNGLLFAQNAFNCGSGPDGSIPMHLKCNDRFETDWDPLLKSVGLKRSSDNWYEKVAVVEPFASVSAV